MKKTTMLFTMLAATLLLSHLPAFSGTGPFGTVGPSDTTDIGNRVETHSTATVGGTGPYGAFGFINAESGVVSQRTATSGGTGPYGAIASYGMIPSSGTTKVDNRDGCVLVAINCPTSR
jgi:hypothetical protein